MSSSCLLHFVLWPYSQSALLAITKCQNVPSPFIINMNYLGIIIIIIKNLLVSWIHPLHLAKVMGLFLCTSDILTEIYKTVSPSWYEVRICKVYIETLSSKKPPIFSRINVIL